MPRDLGDGAMEASQHKGATDMKSIKNYELKIRRVKIAEAGAPYGEPVSGPTDVTRIAQALIGEAAEEHFVAIHLDIKNRVLGYTEIARGSIDGCPVDVRTVYRAAIALGASAIVAAHCHPSGDATPSSEDIALTKRLAEVGALIGLPLLDHVIVTDDRTASLRERGLM